MYNFHTFQNIPPKCLNQPFSTIYMVEIYDYGLSDILNLRLCTIYILNVSLRFIYHLKSKIVPHLHFRCNFTVHLINLRLRPICILEPVHVNITFFGSEINSFAQNLFLAIFKCQNIKTLAKVHVLTSFRVGMGGCQYRIFLCVKLRGL